MTGDDYKAVVDHAIKNGYAIPAVNCTMSTVTNACLEAAKKANSPMIIQFSNGGGAYNAGKGWKNEKDQKAAIMGCVAGALHVRALAEFYGVPIILHTDHCAKSLLPWFDGLLEAMCPSRAGRPWVGNVFRRQLHLSPRDSTAAVPGPSTRSPCLSLNVRKSGQRFVGQLLTRPETLGSVT